MTVLFVTGTGTDIGKTFVTARLIREARDGDRPVRALKPLLSGFDPAKPEVSDSGVLLAAMGLAASDENIATITPWRFTASLAPNMAARAENSEVDLEAVIKFCCTEIARADIGGETLYIEGVGGLMSPISDTTTNLDWIAALGIPALMVAGTYLGAKSHTLTAVAAMKSAGVVLAGIMISESEGEHVGLAETQGELERFLGNVAVTVVARDQ
ncbi:MAG: dethiobiotin synthase [Pseudomonadota bacterium]|nr:dethiobiotin synthase [Pseudomonadota bacterium]